MENHIPSIHSIPIQGKSNEKRQMYKTKSNAKIQCSAVTSQKHPNTRNIIGLWRTIWAHFMTE